MEFTEAWDDTCSSVGIAARIGNLSELRRLIENTYPVDAPDNRGWRPLHEAAAEADDLKCLEMLLKHSDTDVNWITHEGETALLLACKRRCRADKKALEAVRILLKYNANPNIADNEEETPLLAATRAKLAPVVLKLLKKKASPNQADCSGWCPLHEAATLGLADVVSTLLKFGAKIDMQDECGMTPIFTSAQHGKLDCLKILLDCAKERGEEQLVDMSAEDGATPLMIAAQQGFTECVELLLSYGANPNLRTLDNVTAIHLAVQGEHIRCVELLMDNVDLGKLNLIYRSQITDATMFAIQVEQASPLHLAVEWHSIHCLRILLDRGLLVDCLSRNSLLHESQFSVFLPFFPEYETALSYAIRKDEVAADILLEAGANCNAMNDQILHPLIPAILKSSIPLITKLINHGSNVNYQQTMVPSNQIILIALKDEKLLLHLLFLGADPSLCFPKDSFPSIQYFVESLFYHHHNQYQILKILRMLFLFTGVNGRFQTCVDIVGQKCREKFAEYDSSLWEKFVKEIENPSTLMIFCRLCIRRHLSKIHRGPLNNIIHQLNLPKTLIVYLNYEDTELNFQ